MMMSVSTISSAPKLFAKLIAVNLFAASFKTLNNCARLVETDCLSVSVSSGLVAGFLAAERIIDTSPNINGSLCAKQVVQYQLHLGRVG